MKISVLGAGNVGSALGNAWTKNGHHVVYGIRSPGKDSNRMSVENAVAASDIIVLAVPWGALKNVLSKPAAYQGKIVVDCTNPINADFTGLAIGNNDSAGETVGRLVPQAKVVKAFNTCGFNVMANPLFPSGSASMLIAGDDKSAKEAVSKLAQEIGFEPVDAGPLVQSRYMEAFAWLWISMAMKYGSGREIAFRLLHR